MCSLCRLTRVGSQPARSAWTTAPELAGLQSFWPGAEWWSERRCRLGDEVQPQWQVPGDSRAGRHGACLGGGTAPGACAAERRQQIGCWASPKQRPSAWQEPHPSTGYHSDNGGYFLPGSPPVSGASSLWECTRPVSRCSVDRSVSWIVLKHRVLCLLALGLQVQRLT